MVFAQFTGKRTYMPVFHAVLCFALAIVFSMAVPLHAQTTNGTVTGTVSDPSGAIISGVKVTIKNTETGEIRNVMTNNAGLYSAPALPPGSYSVDATATGFAEGISNVTLSIGQTLTVDFHLLVGGGSQKVEVVANGSIGLQTEDHDLESIMDAKTMEDTPQYSGYRGAAFYIQSTNVGVQPVSQQGASVTNGSNVTNYNEQSNALLIGGQNVLTTIYLQDGVVDMNYFDQTATVQPPVEGTQEVQVIRNAANARYDDATVVNVISKSGTEGYHGRAYEEFQNNQMNARGYEAGALSHLRYNQFGANGGGPVPFTHKKVFFFVDYQGFRDYSATFLQDLLPTAAERAGNFTADTVYNTGTKVNGTNIYDPLTWNGTVGTNGTPNISIICDPASGTCPGAGTLITPANIANYSGANHIPASRIQNFPTAYLNLIYPLPNYGNTTVGDNYGSSADKTSFTHDDWLYRGDWNISDKDHLYGAYNTNNPLITRPEFVAFCLCREPNDLLGTDIYVEESHVFSNSLVNTGRVGYSRSITGKNFGNVGVADFFTQLGLTGLMPAPAVWQWPNANPSVYSGWSGSPVTARQNMYEYSDEINLTKGRHSMFFGAEYDRVEYDGVWDTGNPNGSLGASGQQTYYEQFNSSGTPVTYSGGSYGSAWENGTGWIPTATSIPAPNALADYLLGYYSSTGANAGVPTGQFRQFNLMPYFQDNWRVNNKLTLNLGLRYDYYSPPTDKNNTSGTYNIYTNTYHVGSYSPNTMNFSPRIGAAYALNDKTAIHAGYGLYYYQFAYVDLSFMETDPFYITQLSAAQTQSEPVVWTGTATNPYTGAAHGAQNILTLADIENNIWSQMPAPTGVYTGGNAMLPGMPTSYSEQWNLAVQHTFGNDTLVTIDYLGTEGHHQTYYGNLNQASLPTAAELSGTCSGTGCASNTTNINSRRPFQYANLNGANVATMTKWGSSHYHGLEAEVSHRFRGGLQFKTSYVWQKMMDTQSSDNHASSENIWGPNPQPNYGRADFDQKYVYKASGIYELPWGKGKRWLSQDNWWQNALGGWRVSGIFTVNGGFPYTVTTTDQSYTGGGITQFVNVTCNPNQGAPHTFASWLNTGCLAAPSPGTFGNEQRNAMDGPRNTNMDLSVFKDFNIYKDLIFQWRTDAYSALNHPLPAAPQTSYTSTTFNQITSWGGARAIQLNAKIIF